MLFGYAVREQPTKERTLWRDISDFIYRGIPPSEDWQFDAAPAKKEEEAPERAKK